LDKVVEGATVMEHLLSVWERTGVKPARLADAPAMPEGLSPLWHAYCDMRNSCPSNGMGPGRITFAELDAYQRVTGHRLAPWHVDAIRRVDVAYINATAK
jgi:hypothetical protein